MDIKMKYVYMVYKEKSFTRAAEKLYISQPSLSAMVKKAEQELGTAIFDRGTSPLELTPAGQAYIEYLESVLQCEDTLNEKLWDIQNLSKGNVRLGGSNYVLSSIIPMILRQVMPSYPGIRIGLTEEKSFSLRRMLQDRELDLVIDSVDMDDDDTLVFHPLLNEQILLAVPQQEEENRRLRPFQVTPEMIRRGEGPASPMPPEEMGRLLGKPFILLKPENNMFQQARKIFEYYHTTPTVLLQLDQLITSLQYTQAALGCSFVTDTLFRYGKHREGICLYPIDMGGPLCRQLCIIHKRGKYISNPCRLLIETAQQIFGGQSAAQSSAAARLASDQHIIGR